MTSLKMVDDMSRNFASRRISSDDVYYDNVGYGDLGGRGQFVWGQFDLKITKKH